MSVAKSAAHKSTPTSTGKRAGTRPEGREKTAAVTPTFAELGVAAEICDGLRTRGITNTFAIQELTLPLALRGRDLIGQARTGMGKTLAFGVPLLDRVFDDADIAEMDGTPRALVVVPTRELAVQVAEDFEVAAQFLPVRVTTIYGGTPYEAQVAQLRSGADVIVGTPGRLLDLHNQGYLRLDQVAIVVLDEADEMLDMGFLPDIAKLFDAVHGGADGDNQTIQTLLFSATMPAPIAALARTFMNKPVHIHADDPGTASTHTSTKKITFQSHRMDKLPVIQKVLSSPGRGRTIIFTRTKRSAAELSDDLRSAGIKAGAVHGNLNQQQRSTALEAFRRGTVNVLVATDVAARGIDVDDVTHVINYQVPDDPMSFVHRIGRTGRAGRTGIAVTLVGYDELGKWRAINDELGFELPEPPQWFSSSPELAHALGLADD